MSKSKYALAAVFLVRCIVLAQTPPKPAATASLAESGHCREVLPQLKRSMIHTEDVAVKRRVGVAGVRCSMQVNDAAGAVTFLVWLNHEFPHDPAVLYLSSHVYSDLSMRASNELLSSAPASPQVRELNAEALETMGKWKEAADEYRAVLAKDPNLPGIHYRLGRLMLSMPDAPSTVKDDAKKEFEEELKVDPNNAGAEFVLGELARQAEQWPDAIAHFSKAVKLDTSFADAYLGLGRSYMGSDQPAQAVPPLELAAKLQPDNPVVHFQLATAYRRSGRKADADRELLAHQKASQKAEQAKDDLKRQMQGGAADKPR
jgi:tetratricopeptide (TPR) repeat protein